MAETEAPRKGGKLNLRNPGPLEFAVVAGAVVGLVLLANWWGGRGKTAQPAAAAAARPVVVTQPAGGSRPLVLWIHDHQSQPRRRRKGK